MKLLVLCAGQGSRLRPYTDTVPKCMVPYRGRPLLHYTLANAREVGIEDVVIFSGYKAEAIKAQGASFVLNSRYESTNMVYTLFCGENHLDDDILISYGDIVYTPEVLRSMVEAPNSFSVAVDTEWRQLWNLRMEDPLEDAESLKLDESGNVIELGKKPLSVQEIQGQYIGLIKIRKELLPHISQFYHSLDRNRLYDGRSFDGMFMTSFIQLLIDSGMPVTAVKIRGGWFEIDTPSDLSLDYSAVCRSVPEYQELP